MDPLYSADELGGIIPVDTRKPFDVRGVIARIVGACQPTCMRAHFTLAAVACR